jgi:hypothetical protein
LGVLAFALPWAWVGALAAFLAFAAPLHRVVSQPLVLESLFHQSYKNAFILGAVKYEKRLDSVVFRLMALSQYAINARRLPKGRRRAFTLSYLLTAICHIAQSPFSLRGTGGCILVQVRLQADKNRKR